MVSKGKQLKQMAIGMAEFITGHVSIGLDAQAQDALARIKAEGYSTNKLMRKLILQFATTEGLICDDKKEVKQKEQPGDKDDEK